MPFSVIPAEAGIQYFKELMTDLDPGFRRGDDFLRVHQCSSLPFFIFYHSTLDVRRSMFDVHLLIYLLPLNPLLIPYYIL